MTALDARTARSLKLLVCYMKPGAPYSACGEGRVFSGVPHFVTCERCKVLGFHQLPRSPDRIASAV